MKLPSVTYNQGLVLVGIFCRVEDVMYRNLRRITSHRLTPRGVTLRFVICNSSTSYMLEDLQAEASIHGDLLLLDCEENMDGGKSPLYFRTVARRYPQYLFLRQDGYRHVQPIL